MAKLDIRTEISCRASFTGGYIMATMTRKKTFRITAQKLQGSRRNVLNDYAEALKLVINHVGKVTSHTVNLRGTHIDPDESRIGASYQVFPHDKRYIIAFERDDQTGYVKVDVPGFLFTDLSSAAQVYMVCGQVSALMKQYELMK